MKFPWTWGLVGIVTLASADPVPVPIHELTVGFEQPLPENCERYTGRYAENGGLWCVVRQGGLKGGDGPGKRGDPHPLISVAPKGYRLRWSEAHVGAEDHHCGVKDEGDVAPSPFNGDHKREGEAFWAMCIIEERDDQHVKVNVWIEGKEGATNWIFESNHPLIIKKDKNRQLTGHAELYAIFVPIESGK